MGIETLYDAKQVHLNRILKNINQMDFRKENILKNLPELPGT